MAPPPVVKNLDVFEERGARFLAGSEAGPMNHLGLQRSEEAFHRSVVQAIAPPAHRRCDAAQIEQLLVLPAGILDASITVMEQPFWRAPISDSHFQRVFAQGAFEALRHRPSHDLHRPQVLDRGQVKPALVGRNVGDVGQPDGVWCGDVEMPVEKVRRNAIAMAAVCRHGHAPRAPWGANSVFFHQPGN